MGTVGILNVGAGDTKLTFDKNNPAECIRAGRIVTDMLKRGYALLVDVGKGKYQRVKKFDAEKCEYIIADFDSAVSVKGTGDKDESQATASRGAQEQDRGAAKARGIDDGPSLPVGRKRKDRAISAAGTNAVAVARTAGG